MGDEVAIREPLDKSSPKMSRGHMLGERYKSYMRRPLLIICGLIILVLLIIIIILAALLARSTDTNTCMKESICEEEHCIRTASRLLGAMKTEVDPCDNFYEFACGQWVDKHRVPEDKGSIDTMEEVSDRLERDLQDLLEAPVKNDIDPIEKAKQYYKACMDTESVSAQGVNKMLQYISDIGGWPVLDKNWDGQKYDLEARIAQARQYTTNFVWPIPSSILVGLNILNDYKIYGKHVIYFDQPSLLMEGRDMYQDEQLKKAYYKYTTDVAVALGADPNVADTQMKELVDFEVELAEITIAVSERRDMEGNYRRMNVSQLSSIYPTFDWLRYMKAVFKDAGVTITNEESVVLWMKPYYDKLFPLLKKTPNRIIANYVVWRLITEQLISLDAKFSLMNLEFRKVSEGVKQLKTRSLRCSENTNQYLEHATGRMYAEKIFGPKERKHMLELITYLRRIFKNIVNTANWMDSVTKTQALEKLETMKSLIGFPSLIFNDTILTDLYKNVSVSTTDFFGNLQTIRRYVSLQQLAELRKPSYERWPERPAIVNAFYHSGLNAIVFPAGILQSPYYDINYPASINFGGIGLVIGHEITHGYDASGRAFDAKGLLHNWWSDFSMENFNKKAECVVKHYSEFEVPNIGMNINGNNTLSENIADIGGIKQSHLAYRLWLKEHGNKDIRLPGLTGYSNEQLFFINTAQLWCSKFTDEAARRSVLTSEHSLPMFRVLGELRNSYGFSEAFQCPVGSYMNPTEDKCSIW